MNIKLTPSLLTLAQCILIAPALLLCALGVPFILFRWEWLNGLMGTLGSHAVGQLLLSPVLVVGGLVACVGWNVWQIFRVSFEKIHESWVFCLSVQRKLSHLAWMALGSTLLFVVMAYVFVENVVITLRAH